MKFVTLMLTLVISSCSSFDKIDASGNYQYIVDRYGDHLDTNSPTRNFIVGEAFRKSNRIQEALPFYKSAVANSCSNQYVYLRLAQSLKATEDYQEAEIILKNGLNMVKDHEVKEVMEAELQVLSTIQIIQQKKNYYTIFELKSLNTGMDEYSPVFRGGYLYFVSNRDVKKIYKTTGMPFSDIYRVNFVSGSLDFQSVEILDPIINFHNVNEGTASLTGDGRSMIFAKANDGSAGDYAEVNLFYTRFRNGEWLTPKPLLINDPMAWDSTPFISDDGQTLYFSSNRSGGYGGTDIYMAKLNRRGRWTEVHNLGPEINTMGNEQFPFLSIDGTLYFSSDGHPGLGRLDIFKSYRKHGSTVVENLGIPMNSGGDDFGYFEKDPGNGWFSSNRSGGVGHDDIYSFINNDPDLKIINYFLEVTVITINNSIPEVLMDSKVTLVRDERVVDVVFSGDDGSLECRIDPEETYHLIGEKNGYFTTRKNFSTKGLKIKKDTLTQFASNFHLKTDLILEKIVIDKPVVLNDIYYDLDKAEIRPDAARVLDSLAITMTDNPGIIIEMSSHTDERADDSYNMKLSWDRARSAANYLISKGIDPLRVTYRGYGETHLIVHEAETEAEHQVNRRTEFKVLKMNNDPTTRVDEENFDRFFKLNDSDSIDNIK